jgi:ABC-type oligopeptide transport system substrate-binding subunit
LIERAEKAKVAAEWLKNHGQIYKTLAQELPALPLFVQEKETYLVSKKIGRKVDSFKTRLADQTWWVKPPL